MRQLPLALSGRSASSFDDFVVGANDVAVAQLRALADAPAPVFVWGDPGCGKTHVMDALTRGGTRGWFGPAASAPWAFDPGWRWIVLDDVHRLDAAQQRDAFALLVEAQTFAVPWAAAAPVPSRSWAHAANPFADLADSGEELEEDEEVEEAPNQA